MFNSSGKNAGWGDLSALVAYCWFKQMLREGFGFAQHLVLE
jgi:hypothetical protein